MSLSVLYIAGLGRSGSTLLARLLGEVPGVFNAGECARYLFTSHMYERSLPCSCTLSPDECEFWRHLTPLVSDEDRELATRLLRVRNMPLWSVKEDDASTAELRQVLATVYVQLAERSGAEVVVDASKHPAGAKLVSSSDQVQLHIVHLVRDPRAVVASRRKPKSYLRAINPGLVASRWNAFNIASETLGSHGASFQRVRYEDFVDDPSGVLREILGGVMTKNPQLDFIEGRTARLTPQHALAGNPDKLDGDSIEIRQVSYQLPGWMHWAVTAVTFPLLLRYGYPLAPVRA